MASPMETVRHLSTAIGPRLAGSDSETLAATWLANRLSEAGFTVEIDEFVIPVRGRSRNVIGRVGPGPWRILGAHMDTKRGSPGADDNASGCAVILDVAPKLPAKGGSWMIVFFGAEEMQTPRFEDHHYGSRRLASILKPSEIVDMTNVDMVGMGPDLRIRSMTINGQVERLLLAARRVNITAAYMSDRKGLSDHEAFEKRGVHAAWLERRPSPYYHSPRDRIVREEYLTEAVRILEELY